MKGSKVEETEILAPQKRKKALPCSVGRTCLDAYCKRRVYNLSEAQITRHYVSSTTRIASSKTLERLEALTEDDGIERIPNICDVQKCRKRQYPNFIRMSYCIKAKCKWLDTEKTQCRLRPKRGRVTLEQYHHTLRMHSGHDKGWHYRKL